MNNREVKPKLYRDIKVSVKFNEIEELMIKDLIELFKIEEDRNLRKSDILRNALRCYYAMYFEHDFMHNKNINIWDDEELDKYLLNRLKEKQLEEMQ